MDPMTNLYRELVPHVLFTLPKNELIPLKEVSRLWNEIILDELDRRIFLEYAPPEAMRETFRADYGVESPEHLLGRIKEFVESAGAQRKEISDLSFSL